MRVLCIGDSLGLPREGVSYEDTWFYKLKCNYPQTEFVSQFERRLLIDKAFSNFDSYYIFYPSDIVIIQTGICDCSPRYIIEEKLYVQILKSLCNKLGIIDYFWKIVKLRGRKENCVYTPINIFSEKFDMLVSKFIDSGVKHIIVVKIGHAAESVTKKSLYFNNNVDKYNDAIDRLRSKYPGVLIVVNPLNDLDDSNYVDGYHCSAKGMNVVYNSLKTELEKIQ